MIQNTRRTHSYLKVPSDRAPEGALTMPYAQEKHAVKYKLTYSTVAILTDPFHFYTFERISRVQGRILTEEPFCGATFRTSQATRGLT